MSRAARAAESLPSPPRREPPGPPHQFADAVQDQVDDLLADGVVATGIVVGRVFLPGDQLLRVEELPVGPRAHLICGGQRPGLEDAGRAWRTPVPPPWPALGPARLQARTVPPWPGVRSPRRVSKTDTPHLPFSAPAVHRPRRSLSVAGSQRTGAPRRLCGRLSPTPAAPPQASLGRSCHPGRTPA